MKNFRGTLFFAVVVIGIGIFALSEYKKDQKEKSDQPTKDNIFRDAKAENVSEFSFSSATNKYSLKKENGSWKVLEPNADVADGEAVETASRDLFSQNITLIDTSGDIDWAKYGLAQPQAEFQFKIEGATPAATISHKVALGTVRTYDQGFYVKRDDEAHLFASDKSWENLIRKTARDFRSKSFNLPDVEVIALKIVSHDPKRSFDFDFIKSEQGWTYAKDKKIRISDGAISDYATELRHIKNDSLVSDAKSPDEIKKWNLNKAELEITVTYQGKEKPATKVSLAFSSARDNNVSDMGSENGAIYSLAKSKVDPLFKTLDDFRDKTFPFSFDHTKATRIEVNPGGDDDPVKLIKKDNNWVLDDDNPHAKVDQAQVDAMLNGIRLLKVEAFNPKGQKLTGFDHSIILKDQTGKEIFSLSFGNKFTSGKDSFYVAKSNLASEAFALNKNTVDELKYKKLVDDGKPQPDKVVETGKGGINQPTQPAAKNPND